MISVGRLSADEVIEEEYGHELLRAILATASLPNPIAPAGVVQPTVTSLRLQFVCSHTFQQLPWMFTGKRIRE